MTPRLNSTFQVGDRLPTYTVRAHNASIHSENKIHEDTVAKQYGFRGGLVPGVTVHAYMTRPFAEHLGIDWIDHGGIGARFLQPFYEGDQCQVEATVAAADESGLQFEVVAKNQDGEICATGSASLPVTPPEAPPADTVPYAPRPMQRPAASMESLAPGTVLTTLDFDFQLEGRYADFLDEVADDLAVYRGDNAIAHPGYLVRWANSALVESVVLGPWIHVSSEVQHHSVAQLGDHIVSSAVVTDVFERKGHQFVDLDVLLVANGERPLMRIDHRAIYQLRT